MINSEPKSQPWYTESMKTSSKNPIILLLTLACLVPAFLFAGSTPEVIAAPERQGIVTVGELQVQKPVVFPTVILPETKIVTVRTRKVIPASVAESFPMRPRRNLEKMLVSSTGR